MSRNLNPLFTWRGAICSEESQLPPASRHIALTLSLHMNERGGSCFPSVATLAEETGLSVRAVQYQLQILESTGWLSVIRPETQGRGIRNEYTAVVPGRVQQLHLYPWQKGATDDTEGCNERPGKGATDDTVPAHPISTEDVKTKPEDAIEVHSTPSAAALVGLYVDEAQANGYQPSQTMKGQIAKGIKRLQNEGREERWIIAAIKVAASENKPGRLDLILTDLERSVNRHGPESGRGRASR